jgi:DNA-binding MarR family transcriptional regulator
MKAAEKRDQDRPSEAGFIVAKIHQVSGRIFGRLLREEGRFPINPAQGRILFALWKGKGRMSVGALSRETCLEPSTLTSMLDRLEAAGLVRRLPSAEDRRVVEIERTEADRALESRYSELSGRMTRLFYRGFSASEIAAFESALARILGNLEEEEQGARPGRGRD